MIWNRPANLWLAAATAIFNVVVLILHGYNIDLPPELILGVNGALAAIIALVAAQPPTVTTNDSVNVKTGNGTPNKIVTFAADGTPSTSNVDSYNGPH